MPKINERTLKMKENYVRLHDEGHSVKEIAKMFSITPFTIYDHLDEIAKDAGRTRASLLERVIIADHSGRNFTPVKPVNTKQLNESFGTVVAKIKDLEQMVSQTIEEQETMNKLLEEDFEK